VLAEDSSSVDKSQSDNAFQNWVKEKSMWNLLYLIGPVVVIGVIAWGAVRMLKAQDDDRSYDNNPDRTSKDAMWHGFSEGTGGSHPD
jgi:hypothetical protein